MPLLFYYLFKWISRSLNYSQFASRTVTPDKSWYILIIIIITVITISNKHVIFLAWFRLNFLLISFEISSNNRVPSHITVLSFRYVAHNLSLYVTSENICRVVSGGIENVEPGSLPKETLSFMIEILPGLLHLLPFLQPRGTSCGNRFGR